MSLAPGDWSLRGKNSLKTYPDDGTTDAQFLSCFANLFTSAVIGPGPDSFPGRSWTKADVSPKWVCLLESICGLLSASYPRFLSLLGHRLPANLQHPALPAVDDLPGENFLAIADIAAADGELGDDRYEGPNAAEGDEGLHAQAAAASAQRAADPYKQEKRDQTAWRNGTWQWIQSGTLLPDSLIMATTLAPHMRLMAGELFRAGDKWERKMQAERVASNPEVGEHGAASHPCRLENAWLCESEQKFMEETAKLINDEMSWSALPNNHWTEATAATAFAAISKGRCRVEACIKRRKNYPYKLLVSSRRAWVREEIETDRGCLRRLDSLSTKFLEVFPDLSSADAVAALELLLIMARDEMVGIEVGHGHLRRFIVRRSTQCQAIDFKAANAYWIHSRIAALEAGIWGEKRSARADESADEAPDRRPSDCKAGQNKRNLSGWNVFVAEQSDVPAGALPRSVQELSTLWRELEPDRRQHYRELALLANIAMAAGNPNPLASSRDLSMQSTAIVQFRIETCRQLALKPVASIWNEIPSVKRLLRTKAREETAALDKERSNVAKWVNEGAGSAMRARFFEETPSLSEGVVRLDANPILSRPPFAHFEGSFPRVRADIRALMCLNKQSQRDAAKLHKVLDGLWDAVCKPVLNKDAPPVDAKSADMPPPKSRLCYAAGYCLCGDLGRNRLTMMSRLLRAIKQEYAGQSGATILRRGWVAVVMLGSLPLEEGHDEGHAVEVRYLHIGIYMVSPSRISFSLMAAPQPPHFRRDTDDASILALPDDAFYLSARQLQHDLFDEARMWDQGIRWEAVLCDLRKSNRLVAPFRPQGCTVVHRRRLHMIWNPVKKKRGSELEKSCGRLQRGLGICCTRRC